MTILSSPISWLLLIIIGSMLLLFAYSFLIPAKSSKKEEKVEKTEGKAGSAGVCPVCRTPLLKNEQIMTRVYQGTGDCTCLVYGCLHCYPIPEKDVLRRCPVCHMHVNNTEYLVACLMERSFGKHVRIKGCKRCQKGY